MLASILLTKTPTYGQVSYQLSNGLLAWTTQRRYGPFNQWERFHERQAPGTAQR